MSDFTINGLYNTELVDANRHTLFTPRFTIADSILTAMNSDYGCFLFQYFPCYPFSIWHSEYRMQETALLRGTMDGPVLEMHFMLKQGMTYKTEGLGRLEMPASTFNLYYEPYAANEVLLQKGREIITFDIHLELTYLEQYCTSIPGLHSFIEQALKRQATSLSKRPVPISRETGLLIQSFFNTPSRGSLQQDIFQSRIDALLLQALYALTETRPVPLKTTTYQERIIKDLTHYLRTNPDSSKRMPELVQQSAMNDFQLKQFFKQLNGIPIHQFLVRERMQKACDLLENSQMPISEIAYEIGYRSSGAFINAFSKFYLTTPLQYRKRKT